MFGADTFCKPEPETKGGEQSPRVLLLFLWLELDCPFLQRWGDFCFLTGGVLIGVSWHSLWELLELFHREARVSNDTAHCVFIDGIGLRNCKNSTTVTHHDVLALTDDFGLSISTSSS